MSKQIANPSQTKGLVQFRKLFIPTVKNMNKNIPSGKM